MPPRKKQRTGEDSSAPTQEREEEREQEQQAESSTAQQNEGNDGSGKPKLRNVGVRAKFMYDSDHFQTKDIPEHEYIGMHRPRFDYEIENRLLGEESKEDDDFDDWYSSGFDAEKKAGVMLEPAKNHPEHKWCIMWEGFKMFMDYRRRSNYCCPDNFGMYIYNDFEGWGYQELIENFIVAFDASLKKKDDNALKHTWAIVSALSLWLNEIDQGPLIGNENGEKTQAVIGLVGYALLRGLAALDFADELKPDTSFPDIPIVITSLLEFSSDLPEYGIENKAVNWRPHAAAYFKKGNFPTEKGISNTEKILESASGGSEDELAKKTEKDPWGWGWDKMLKAYKQSHGSGGKIGGAKYDITKMSRKQRASHAFDKKDPLAGISDKDLKEGNLDLA
ncbi:hypothetical protein EKO04_003417 [Ascochyta lentis]|uniref:Uncharacterized protein n=1 Tax=Ascochyta lentis TaxID=205686 RepID=A0A8H7MKK2_9PLEO|nr:hypothetical protein EKO04_003417 [Ascochyta lentis]